MSTPAQLARKRYFIILPHRDRGGDIDRQTDHLIISFQSKHQPTNHPCRSLASRSLCHPLTPRLCLSGLQNYPPTRPVQLRASIALLCVRTRCLQVIHSTRMCTGNRQTRRPVLRRQMKVNPTRATPVYLPACLPVLPWKTPFRLDGPRLIVELACQWYHVCSR